MTLPAGLPIASFQTMPVVTIAIDADVEAAASALAEHAISSLLVVERDGTAAGVLSRRDLLALARHARQPGGEAVAMPTRAVGDVMHAPVISVAESATVSDAARLMCAHHIHRVYVLDAGRPLAVFSTRDAMAAVRAARLAQPIVDIMSTGVVSMDHVSTLGEVLARLDREGLSGVIVCEHGLAVGIFDEACALAHRHLSPQTPLDGLFDTSLLQLPGRVPLYRAAAFTQSTAARRIVVLDPVHHTPRGVVTGLDFCRALIAVDAPGRDRVRASGPV